ncbi:MAG: hypothetical protein HQ580_16155 [Planctomycetes bacterium]|nr:hypothetical protein [Planctomycetota bacterium]
MEHKITEEEIEKKTMSFVIASAADWQTGEAKDLKLIFSEGKIEWVVRYFRKNKLEGASKPLRYLETAIKVYNSF